MGKFNSAVPLKKYPKRMTTVRPLYNNENIGNDDEDDDDDTKNDDDRQ